MKTINDACNYSYFLCDIAWQLKPYSFFVELFCRGVCDEDSLFVLFGVVFGFNVIDECNVTNDSKARRPRSEWEWEL